MEPVLAVGELDDAVVDELALDLGDASDKLAVLGALKVGKHTPAALGV